MSLPTLTPDDKSIRDHLNRILGSARFARSPQLTQLLKYVVASTLAGEEPKESTVGEAIFGKPADWDSNQDSKVRTYAHRLRAYLEKFYEEEGRFEALRIEIPKGTYVPEFRFVEAEKSQAAAPVDNATGPTHPPPREDSSKRVRTWLIWACAMAGVALAAALALNKKEQQPEPGISKPLTRDGRAKGGPLITDGVNVYFRQVTTPPNAVLTSVSVDGGNVAAVPIPLGEPVCVCGWLAHALLVFGTDEQNQGRYWKWTPNHPPEPLEPAALGSIRIDESLHLEVRQRHLVILERNRPERTISVPGDVGNPSWNPLRKRLRFDVSDLAHGTRSMWEVNGIDGQPVMLQEYPKNAYDGRWNSTGDIFTFLTAAISDEEISEVWIADERPPSSIDHPRISRFTRGPLMYSNPIAAADGHAVFAFGHTDKPELVRYDAARATWAPYLGGISGFETDFSRDGRWIAFVRHPDRTLWKMRSDGTDLKQLTYAPFEAIQPQWSPDGRQIAFMGHWPGGHHLVYLISASGGQPQSLITEPADQGIPTWSADGSKLVFGELLTQRPGLGMRIHVLDVSSRKEQPLENSAGMWTPRWSPDGRWIAALTWDSKGLRLYDTRAGRWEPEVLVSFSFIESPAWTADSKQIYFKTGDHDKKGVPDFRIQRIDLRSKRMTMVADLNGLETPGTGWYGLTREGSPLALRDTKTTDVYSISVPH